MALTDDQQATLRRLRARLDRDMKDRRVNGHRVPGFKSLEAYAEGMQRLAQLGLAVPEDLREFVTIVDWPGSYADALITRMRPVGFLLGGQVDEELWATWQANGLDADIRMALTDMIHFGRGYICDGVRDEDDPVRKATPADQTVPALITVESPLEMVHEWSNRYRRVTAAARFYCDDDGPKKIQRATLYEPNATTWLVKGSKGWEIDPDEDPDEHNIGRVLVHPLVNRAKTNDRYGVSELLRIIQLTDAAARALTNAQLATETVAIPQKWAAAMSLADFKDPKTGEAITEWETYIGSIWASTSDKAKFGQFSAADLANFRTIVSLYAQLAAGVTGLPMRYFGQLSDNPPSADGIRADEARLVGLVEDKQIFAGEGIEASMRDARRIETEADDVALLGLETRWRNAATPTLAQTADAATKAYGAGLITKRQARSDMGYTPNEITQMEDEDAAALIDPVIQAILKGSGVPAPTGT